MSGNARIQQRRGLERRGYTLIEVVIAMAVVTFMFLTVAALQLEMSERAQQFDWQTTALQQLDNMLATIAVNQADTQQWHRDNAQRLPQGQASWKQGVLALQWQSESAIWNCPTAKINHYACFAVEVAQ